MENVQNLVVWKAVHKTTKKFMWLLLLAAAICFLAGAALANEVSSTDFMSLTCQNFDIIGCAASAIFSIACWLVVQSHNSDDLSKMTEVEKSTHVATLKKVRLATIVFLLMFGGFFVIVSFRQLEIGNFAVLSCQACGVVFLGLTVLASKMANQIKITYLNPRSTK